MSCCGQNTTGAGAAAVDTGKRVNYVKGMLLGVDDFVQEQAWGIARRHELARELLGYGTVRGLRVSIDPGAPRVRVSPGMAWTPSGAPVCVGSEQCCDVNAWLLKNKAAVQPLLVGDPAPLTVYVVLSYAALPTDKMPIPGEPCRSEDALMADSRIADCFCLELRLAPPDQLEENAIRDFADWLARIPVDPTSPPLSDDAFEAQLREAAHAWLEPTSPHVGDFMFGSPPLGLGTTDALVRAALRLWATELRPRWRARYGCGPDPLAAGGSNDAVLLAALSLSVYSNLEAAPDVGIDETQRPVLLSLRMVQELIAQNPAPEPGDNVMPADAFGLPPTAGIDAAYSRADHSHGTPVLPPLAGDVTGAIQANTLVQLRGRALVDAAPAGGQALVFDPTPTTGGWRPGMPNVGSHAVGGDISGTIAGASVVALRGRSIDSSAVPGDGQALVFDQPNNRWTPRTITATVPPFGGDLRGTIGSETIASLQRVPVKAEKPQKGDVLRFDGEVWRPQAAPAGGPIEIVGAGMVRLTVKSGSAVASVLYSSGRTDVKVLAFGNTQARVFVILSGVTDAKGESSGFVAKLTPVWDPELPTIPSVDGINVESADQLSFNVMMFAGKAFFDGQFEFQFELGRFVPFKAP